METTDSQHWIASPTSEGLERMPDMARIYKIYVCRNCGNGPEVTPCIPGCGPTAVKRGDNLRKCRECGFKGAYVALEVDAAMSP